MMTFATPPDSRTALTENAIPGVSVTLTNNPLNAHVTLTEAARREFMYRFVLRQMEDLAWSVHVYTEPASSVYDPARAAREVARFTAFDGHDVYPENSHAFWDAYARQQGVHYYLDALNETHCGDCTAVACSCLRCQAEQIAGINTFTAGKHMGSRISGMFAPPPATPEALATRERSKAESAAYWDKVKATQPEYWASLQQRWEEERQATDAYLAEHRRLLALQQGAAAA